MAVLSIFAADFLEDAVVVNCFVMIVVEFYAMLSGLHTILQSSPLVPPPQPPTPKSKRPKFEHKPGKR